MSIACVMCRVVVFLQSIIYFLYKSSQVKSSSTIVDRLKFFAGAPATGLLSSLTTEQFRMGFYSINKNLVIWR